jgi:hypothetical protein
MSKRASPTLDHAVRVSLAVRNLAELGDGLLLAVAGKRASRDELAVRERELLFRTRQLVAVLERTAPRSAAGIVNIAGRLRRRSIARALQGDPLPPSAA